MKLALLLELFVGFVGLSDYEFSLTRCGSELKIEGSAAKLIYLHICINIYIYIYIYLYIYIYMSGPRTEGSEPYFSMTNKK